MELIKGKEFISQKLSWLHKGGLKAIEKVTGEESTSNLETTQDQNLNLNQGQNVTQDGTVTTPVEQNNVSPLVTGTSEVKRSEESDEFDDELLWSKQYSYDEFIDSLSHEYEERGNNLEEKRHWNYPRRWMVRLFNLKIVNLTTENFSCFAEFDFGGSRNECRVQIGSNNYILNSGKSKNYIRTPVLKNVEKDSSRNFNCSHSFEYRGSYLDLENEKLRIKVWKCNTYTINTLESIYEEVLIKFAEGDEHVDILMYKYVGGQKKLTCKLSFNLFFQELYDFEINLIKFKIQNAISSYYLFNYQRLYLSKLTVGSNQIGASNTNTEIKHNQNEGMKDWNMINKLKYSIFKFKMERKMNKIDSKSNKELEMNKEKVEEIEIMEDDMNETNLDHVQKNVEGSQQSSDMSNPESDVSSPKNGGNYKENLNNKKNKINQIKVRNKRKQKSGRIEFGVGYVTNEEHNENRDTTLVLMSKNKEYISILRENKQLFVQIGTFVPFECKLPPSPRLSIKLKTSGIYLKKMGLMSHSVRSAFSCEWDNLGEIQFRGTLSELSSSFLEIKLLDWSAPKAANCIGIAIIPLESVVDYPFISSKFYAPEWLRLKSQYEGWGDKLPDLQLGSVSGSLIINRKPRYRQMKGYNNVTSSNQLLIISINNIDQLLVTTQEKVNSFVEVSFNNFTTRTNICKDMLGPIYNEELYIPIQSDLFGSGSNSNTIADYDELLGMGSIRITVWGYVMDRLNYFGSCEIGIREIFFNKNVLRPLSKKTHNLVGNFKYETTYETRVYNTTKKIYHYLYNDQDSISNINLSVWFFPLVSVNQNTNKISTSPPVLPKVGANVNAIREHMANSDLYSEEEKIDKLSEIWKRICLITNNEHFINYYYFFDQFGIKMFVSSFVQVLHPPPSIENLNHIFHFVSCISFSNKRLETVFSIDFLLKLKSGHVLDHCLLLCSFLLNNYNNVYVAIGQQKDKGYNAFVVQINSSSTQNAGKIDHNITGQEKVDYMDNGNTSSEDRHLVVYDLIAKQVVKINLKNVDSSNEKEMKREDLFGTDWVKREMRKLNFLSINILFNNKNIWLNVQENKNIVVLDYDINNINNWYPFIPYNPTKVIPSQFYTKIINTINSSLSNGGNVMATTGRNSSGNGNKSRDKELIERKYHIDWNRLDDYVVDKVEIKLLDELNRNIEIYRSSQNLNTNYNKCNKIQKFLKKYLVLLHEENVSNEDNMKLIKSQINEWKEELERRIPRSYQVLIRTLHFNTVDTGVIFDVIKHKLNFLDSRESSSIFVTTIKIFQLSSNLFSTYFMIMYSSKIHEKLRKEILLHRYLINKKINANKIRKDREKSSSNKDEVEDMEVIAERMEIEQLLVDNEDVLNTQRKDIKRGKKGDLSDVVNKNLKIQTRNFNKLITKQLEKINSFNKGGSYSSNLSSLSGTPVSSNSFSSKGGDLYSEDNEEMEVYNKRNEKDGDIVYEMDEESKSHKYEERGNKGKNKTKGSIVEMKIGKRDGIDNKNIDKGIGDLDLADKNDLLNMPSYEFRSYTTDEFLNKGSRSIITSSSSSILKSILTNSNLYSSETESSVSKSGSFLSQETKSENLLGKHGTNISDEIGGDMRTKNYSRRSTQRGSRVISYRGNTNLHSTLEFSSRSSMPFSSSNSSVLPKTTISFKNLNTITSTDTIKTLSRDNKEEDLRPRKEQSGNIDGMESQIISGLVSIANSENKEIKTEKSSITQSSDNQRDKDSSGDDKNNMGGKQVVVNKKLMLNSKIIKNKNKNKNNVIDNLDQYSKLDSLGLSNNYKSGSSLEVKGDEKDSFFGKGGFLGNIFNTEDYSQHSSESSGSNNGQKNEEDSKQGSSLKDGSNETAFTFNKNLNSNCISGEFNTSAQSSSPIGSSVTFVTQDYTNTSIIDEYNAECENKEMGEKVDKIRNIFPIFNDNKNNKIKLLTQMVEYYEKSSTNKSSFKQTSSSKNIISDSLTSNVSFNSFVKSKNNFGYKLYKSEELGNSEGNLNGKIIRNKKRCDNNNKDEVNREVRKRRDSNKSESPLSTTSSNEEVLVEDDYLDNLSFLNRPTKSGSSNKEEVEDKEVIASKLLAEKLFNSASLSIDSSKYNKNSTLVSGSSISSKLTVGSNQTGTSNTNTASDGSFVTRNNNGQKNEECGQQSSDISYSSILNGISRKGKSNLSIDLSKTNSDNKDRMNTNKNNSELESNIFTESTLKSGSFLSQETKSENSGSRDTTDEFLSKVSRSIITSSSRVYSELNSSRKGTSNLSGISGMTNMNSDRESRNENLISESSKDLSTSTFSSNYSYKDFDEKNKRLYRKVNVYKNFAT